MSRILKFFSALFNLKNQQDKICDLVAKFYRDIDGKKISLKERERLLLQDPVYTYGEIMPHSFARLLKLAAPQKNEVFYDLGAGSGKAVFTAALLYEWKKCYGIEYLPALHLLSINLLPKLATYYPQKKLTIEFIQQDFFDTDLSDANVIFINSTAFNILFWQKLVVKLQRVKPGTRIIAISKRIEDTYFEKIAESMLLQSWGMSSAFVYRKKEIS